MEATLDNIGAFSATGLLDLRNLIIDFFIDPLQFDILIKDIQNKLKIYGGGFAPIFNFEIKEDKGNKRSLHLKVKNKKQDLFTLSIDVITTECRVSKKISSYLIYIEHLRKHEPRFLY